jgi:hypothetical protein
MVACQLATHLCPLSACQRHDTQDDTEAQSLQGALPMACGAPHGLLRCAGHVARKVRRRAAALGLRRHAHAGIIPHARRSVVRHTQPACGVICPLICRIGGRARVRPALCRAIRRTPAALGSRVAGREGERCQRCQSRIRRPQSRRTNARRQLSKERHGCSGSKDTTAGDEYTSDRATGSLAGIPLSPGGLSLCRIEWKPT